MNWIVPFIISVVILAVAIFAGVYCERNKVKRHKLLSGFYIILVGVAVSAFVLFIPYYYYASSTDMRFVQSLLVSLYSVLRTFALDGDYSFFMETVAAGNRLFSTIYLTYTLIIMVAAPFFTFGVVLSFFKDAKARFRFIMRRKNAVYVFSQLNERAVVLAKDLSEQKTDKKSEKPVIVFTNVGGDTETEAELSEQAAEFGAICFKKDVVSVKVKSRKKLCFFVMGGDDGENLRHTMKLIETYKDRAETRIYLFSTSVESELVLSSVDKGKVTVRRVDEIRSLINRMLYDNGNMLFDGARADENGVKQISVIIAGLGQYGSTMLKTLSWFCQMPGYRLKITAVDKDKKAEAKLAYQAPEMMDKKIQGIYSPGMPGYDICVHSDIDATTSNFVDIVKKQTDATFAFVALGTDEDNIKVAADLRMQFERMNIKPEIIAVVHSSETKAALEKVENHRHQPYNIKFIGDIESSYTEAVVVSSALEAEALKSHLAWDGAKESEFWDIEYNYRSSIATTLHKKARLHCGIKPEEGTDLEHCRWFAYMRSEGYIYSGAEDAASRNELGKMHHNMVPTYRLDESDLDKDRRVNNA